MRRRGAAGRSGASMGAELRLAPCGRPNRPQGRNTSTSAMKANSTTSVSLENDTLKPSRVTVPRPMHSALISAMMSAAT